MKRFFVILSLTLCAASAMAQNKMLDWKQLMDYSLYPQRQIHGIVFEPESERVLYTRGDETYVFDGDRKSVV